MTKKEKQERQKATHKNEKPKAKIEEDRDACKRTNLRNLVDQLTCFRNGPYVTYTDAQKYSIIINLKLSGQL